MLCRYIKSAWSEHNVLGQSRSLRQNISSCSEHNALGCCTPLSSGDSRLGRSATAKTWCGLYTPSTLSSTPCRPGVVASSRRCRTTHLDRSKNWLFCLLLSRHVGFANSIISMTLFGHVVRCHSVELNCKRLIKQHYDNGSTKRKMHVHGFASPNSRST